MRCLTFTEFEVVWRDYVGVSYNPHLGIIPEDYTAYVRGCDSYYSSSFPTFDTLGIIPEDYTAYVRGCDSYYFSSFPTFDTDVYAEFYTKIAIAEKMKMIKEVIDAI